MDGWCSVEQSVICGAHGWDVEDIYQTIPTKERAHRMVIIIGMQYAIQKNTTADMHPELLVLFFADRLLDDNNNNAEDKAIHSEQLSN